MATAQPQSTPLSAGARVARIPELLEHILLSLVTEKPENLRTLLLSQRTCHVFHNTITGTPSLRRALCFETASATPTSRMTLNPLFQTNKSHPIRLPNRTKLEITLGWLWNPKMGFGVDPYERSVNLTRSMRRGKPNKKSRDIVNAYGSWRQMRIFKEVGDDEKLTRLKCCWIGGGEVCLEHHVDGEWKNPTLGEIFDLLFPEEVADHVERLAKKGKMPN